eukprot:CAMPEP_0174914142 /NCGR_PEP_ID=MMETSP0167-20121228/80685_1 /TAXON_ID=38298 /ORGANISM="Rhodella maculata, Strain CCMP736" /LENGTH=90 /DNA_ID=CAMNT_0016158893 /DNA_START=533 /DNA_END=805 /DNA_ORIENTATION=-
MFDVQFFIPAGDLDACCPGVGGHQLGGVPLDSLPSVLERADRALLFARHLIVEKLHEFAGEMLAGLMNPTDGSSLARIHDLQSFASGSGV